MHIKRQVERCHATAIPVPKLYYLEHFIVSIPPYQS